MTFVSWLIVGGLMGWLASRIMRTDAQQGLFLNVVVGIVGATVGGLLLAPMRGTAIVDQGNISVAGILVSLLGAVVLLAIVNLFRRGRIG